MGHLVPGGRSETVFGTCVMGLPAIRPTGRRDGAQRDEPARSAPRRATGATEERVREPSERKRRGDRCAHEPPPGNGSEPLLEGEESLVPIETGPRPYRGAVIRPRPRSARGAPRSLTNPEPGLRQ